jgi:hypothetical protein
MEKDTKIKCPNCGTSIDVQDILAHQLEEKVREEFNQKLLSEKQKFSKREEELEKARIDFEEKKKRENELFQDRLEKSIKAEKEVLQSSIKKKLEEEQEEQMKMLQRELNEQSDKLKEFNIAKAEIEKLKREKTELKSAAEAEAQKKLNETLILEKDKIRKAEEEKNELKMKELYKQLEDQKKLTEEMKRKQEQGSMQLQGEVQELAIEEWLAQKFPLDGVEEIKKGARGGDCIQTVNTREAQNCGSIYYESKRTKDFQPSWIEKFKADIRDRNANIGVLVTNVLPSDMDRMGMRDGIWICTYEEFKGLCAVLRQSIIRFNSAVASQENKGDKMHMLYDFLTGNAFRMQVEAIVEGFSQLKIDLETDRKSNNEYRRYVRFYKGNSW